MVLSLIIIFLSSCFEAKEEKTESTSINVVKERNFSEFLSKHSKNRTDFERILVVPSVGCTGCISEAETFFKENYDKEEYLYIFTSIGDLKLLKIKLSDSLLNRTNVLLDYDNTLTNIGFTSIYPSEAKIKGNNIHLEPFIM